jgi:hypothetical protein
MGTPHPPDFGTDDDEDWPRLRITFCETSIAVWVKARPGGQAVPIIIGPQAAADLLWALNRALGDRDTLLAGLAELEGASPDDFYGTDGP